MSHKRILGFAIVLTVFLSTGCSDPVSKRRIDRRWDAAGATVKGMEDREKEGPKRLDGARRTVNRWLEQESKRFNERVKIIGDYVW